jgi:hypothetical protein
MKISVRKFNFLPLLKASEPSSGPPQLLSINLQDGAKTPHSAKMLANVIDQPFTTKPDHPHWFYDGIDLAIFPMDDNSYIRDITFNSHKRGADWFLKICKDRQLKDSPWEETYIYVHWNQVVYL